ncbi:MAG: biotin--[acetyl-CoA-carboxylase] ligase [Evtepia sp.]
MKDQILTALEQARGTFVSGHALATALSVSRTTVCNAVHALQDAGYAIEAVTNRGYRLAPGNGPLSRQSIEKYLLPGLSIEVIPSAPSTNSLLKQRAETAAPEGLVLIAEEQTAGRGRRDHTFFSPSGTGLYMSLLLRPTLPASDALCITTAAAVAVAEAIEEVSGRDAKIKWVNDIFCDGKKVCGILTEASIDLEGGGLHYAILGIGVNVFPAAFPPELNATSVFTTPSDSFDLRSRLAASILNHFMREYPNLSQKNYFEAYRSRSLLLGKPITISGATTQQDATALDLDSDFRLKVQYPDGSISYLSSGEVSVKAQSCIV